MNIVSADGKMVSKVEGLPEVDDKGQGGLLDVALDPDYQNNRTIYWTFSEPVNGGNHTAVAKGKLASNDAAIENATVIYRSNTQNESTLHYGGRVLFDKNGN